MSSLASDVRFDWDASHPPSLAQIRSDLATTFFRGSLVHAHFGKATNLPLASERFIGPAWKRSKVLVGELITVAVTGRFKFFSATFTDANYGELFAVNTALSDNPADFDLLDFGSAGPAGMLDQVSEEGISGWLNIDRRA